MPGPSLLITAVDGTTLTFDCNADPKLNDGLARTQGFMHDPSMTFVIDRWTRKRLSQLEPVVGLNVRQTINRAGRIQLTSDKPCKFVRCRWDSPRNQRYQGWNESLRYQQMEGVLEVTTASMIGNTQETLGLTLWRGDWYWDGVTVERFADG